MQSNSNMVTAERLAAALNARPAGKGKWRACCPAHDDKNPSLSIAETHGRTLVYCFAGCTQQEVIDVLRFRGLWGKSRSKFRRWVDPQDLAWATTVLACANHDRQQGREISSVDMASVKKAAGIIAIDREARRVR